MVPCLKGGRHLRAVLFILISVFSGSALFGGDDCADDLRRAHREYLVGRFDATIVLTSQCLKQRDLSGSVKITALELRALSLLSKDFRRHAKGDIEKIFALNPNYNPQLDELIKPDYLSLVGEVRKDGVDKPDKLKKWVLIGASFTVVAGLVVFLTSH